MWGQYFQLPIKPYAEYIVESDFVEAQLKILDDADVINGYADDFLDGIAMRKKNLQLRLLIFLYVGVGSVSRYVEITYIF